jgi:hypothetical protein
VSVRLECRMTGTGAQSDDIAAHVRRLKEELAAVAQACEAARREGYSGNLFFLLRKRWKLTQRVFEAESAVQLLSGRRQQL